MNATKISGTKEWAAVNVNCITGCEHDCRYCYARANALRFKRITTPEEWAFPKVRMHDVNKTRKKEKGRVMFPTTHDITPPRMAECVTVLWNLLRAGNDVLLVTKPHFECVEHICNQFVADRHHIVWRLSIGAMDDRILSYWEPGAPSFSERLQCLQYAYHSSFATSVSCEPCLDTATVDDLFRTCKPFLTDSFWIGKMNRPRQRCVPGTAEHELIRIEDGQTDEQMRRVYQTLKDEPLIRWKESYSSILGIPQTIEGNTTKGRHNDQ